jgi:hypothetical protein
MTVAEARAALPELSAPQMIGPTLSIAHVDGGADNVDASLFFDQDALSVLAVGLPVFADAEKLLGEAWGPSAPDHTWSDANTGWRAELVPTRINFDTPNEVKGGDLRFTRL